jgi:hypothetical protein
MESPFEAIHPDVFAHDLATAINELLHDPARCDVMGKAGAGFASLAPQLVTVATD